MAVDQRNEIQIDGHRYQTAGKVRTSLVSRQPGKITLGDYTDSSNPMASEFSIGDFRDGIGVEIGALPEDQKRVWWGTTQLRYKNRTVLPRLATETASVPNATAQLRETTSMAIFKEEVWIGKNGRPWSYDNSNDQWTAGTVGVSGAEITDMKVGMIGGTEVLVACAEQFTFFYSDISTAVTNSFDAKYAVFWKDLLWLISDAGQLAYTDAATTAAPTNDAVLQLPAGNITGMLVGRGPDREEHIYLITKVGIYIHDDRNARFIKTDLQLPFHPDGGEGSEVWRGAVYTTAGNAIYSFQAGSDRTIVNVVGPDRDHGLPSNRRGVIRSLIGSHNELFALLDSSTSGDVASLNTRASSGIRLHHGLTMVAETGFSQILGWNERGWEVKWVSGSNTSSITAGVVGTAYNDYRLWWAANKEVYWMDLPVDVVNPLQVSGSTYADSATLETPWMDFGIRNQKKLALSVLMETVNPTSDETVKIEYATDFNETYTEIATQDTTGETEYHLPTRVNREGVVFRAWKFRFTFARGSTTTNTPQMINTTLVWRPRVQPLYGFTTTLDMRHKYDGAEPIEQLENLRDALTKGTLVPMTFKDDDGDDRNYLVDIIDWQSVEESGKIDSGLVQITMAEPVHSSEHEDR